MKSKPRKSLLKRLEASLNMDLRKEEETHDPPTIKLLVIPAGLFMILLMVWWFGAGRLSAILLDQLLLVGLFFTFGFFGYWASLCAKHRQLPLGAMQLTGRWALALCLLMAGLCWGISAWCAWIFLIVMLS